MCKKNLERKVLSPPSSDDIDEIIPKDWEPAKKSSKKKRSKKGCKTCYCDIIENENSDSLRYQNTFHQLLAKNYCENHESIYSDHKCKPSWCGDCGFFIKYEITIDYSKWSR